MSIEHGGPAFPYPEHGEKGISMRDYFAAKALLGMMTNHEYRGWEYPLIAEVAYQLADCMLAARGEE